MLSGTNVACDWSGVRCCWPRERWHEQPEEDEGRRPLHRSIPPRPVTDRRRRRTSRPRERRLALDFARPQQFWDLVGSGQGQSDAAVDEEHLPWEEGGL